MPPPLSSVPAPVPPEPPREAPPESGPPKDVRFPAIRRATLSNGLRVLVVEHHALPVAYTTLAVRAGTARDPADRPGLAEFAADMLLEGTRTRSRLEIVEQIEFVGGEISSGSDADHTWVRALALRDHLDVALDLLADVAAAPAFADEAVDKVRRKIQSELEHELTDPGFLALRAFSERLYGEGHPYAHVAPTEQALAAVTRAELAAFHARHFVPGNAFLVVAGDVAPDAVVAAAEKAFGRWKAREAPPLALPEPERPTERRMLLVDRPGSVQATFFMGAPAVPRTHPDWIDLTVGNQVLGGSASARLFLRLREEKSLTYGAYSRIEARRGTGYAAASANCRNEVAGEALAEFFAVMTRLRDEPIPAQELGYAKSYLAGLFPTQVETAGTIAAMAAQIEIYGLADGYWDTYRSEVLAVTEAEARRIARYLDPERLLVTVVGDADAIRAQIEPFGPVTVVDVDGRPVE